MSTLLSRWFWKPDAPAVKAQKVWLDTCRYLYMPRLLDQSTYVKTVEGGVQHREFLGCAAIEKAPSVCTGLAFGSPANVVIDDAAVLVEPGAAGAAEEAVGQRGQSGAFIAADGRSGSHLPAGAGSGGFAPTGAGGGRSKRTSSSAPPPQARAWKFHGTVGPDAKDPIEAFTEVVENLTEHFTAQYETKATITVGVEAMTEAGSEAKAVRVVWENASTLKFGTAEFDEE